jgi:hypothetical protein
MTEGISRKTVQRILEQALAVNTRAIEEKFDGLASQKRALTEELSLYPPLFLRLLDNLRRFKRELYPPLLFLLGEFTRSRIDHGRRGSGYFCSAESPIRSFSLPKTPPGCGADGCVGAGAMGTAERTEGKQRGERRAESEGPRFSRILKLPLRRMTRLPMAETPKGTRLPGLKLKTRRGIPSSRPRRKLKRRGRTPCASRADPARIHCSKLDGNSCSLVFLFLRNG